MNASWSIMPAVTAVAIQGGSCNIRSSVGGGVYVDYLRTQGLTTHLDCARPQIRIVQVTGYPANHWAPAHRLYVSDYGAPDSVSRTHCAPLHRTDRVSALLQWPPVTIRCVHPLLPRTPHSMWTLQMTSTHHMSVPQRRQRHHKCRQKVTS
jgi:hypothetical protein